MITKTPLILGLASLAFGLNSGADAASAAFRYNDLDLSSAAGRAELEKRIDAVMRQACPEEAITGSRISLDGDRAECMADVRRQIMARCKVDDLAGHRVHGFIAFRGELHRVFCR